jgi:hypothetical protein
MGYNPGPKCYNASILAEVLPKKAKICAYLPLARSDAVVTKKKIVLILRIFLLF